MVEMKAEYFYVLLGGVGWIAFTHYFPSLKKLGSLESVKNIDSLENIEGIDLRALMICRQKGLM